MKSVILYICNHHFVTCNVEEVVSCCLMKNMSDDNNFTSSVFHMAYASLPSNERAL
jgi:hypothetical protein